MPDNPEKTESPAPDKVSAEATGERLRAAREAAGISVTEVNSRIHLTREVVAALESGDFSDIGAPVFVRGHLRNYARLLKLPEAEILSACPDEETEPELFRAQSALKDYKPGFSIVNAVLLAGLVLLLVIVAFYLLLGGEAEAMAVAAPDTAAAAMVSPAAANSNNTGRLIAIDHDILKQA